MGKLTVEQLRAGVQGDVIEAGDAAYEEARRVYNAMIDRRPAVIVRPVRTEDVGGAGSETRGR